MTDDHDGMDREELAEERTRLAEERTENAEHRTEAAHSRSVLANERTFSAWLRTAMSAMAVGLGVAELLASTDYRMVAKLLGVTLIVLGGAVSLLGAKRYYKVADELEEAGVELTPKWAVGGIVAGLLAVMALALILVLRQ